MAFRGRGRRGGWGRGGGSGGWGRGAHVDTPRDDQFKEYIIFPEVNLEGLTKPSVSNEDKYMITCKWKLERFWKDSCYYLEEASQKSKKHGIDIERYSDMLKKKTETRREALASYLKLNTKNFPSELIQGTKKVQHEHKKLRWGRDSADTLFDKLEKLEENYKGDDEKVAKGKNNEDEDEEEAEEDASDDSDDGDYNLNVDFDDDEDDCNMEEEEFEDAYE